MSVTKDSEEVIKFMALFQKLQDWTDDNANDLEKNAAGDQGLERLCLNLHFAANDLLREERRQPRLFSAPVNPKFIGAWRAYEERYASPIVGIFLRDLGLDTSQSPVENKSRADSHWEAADDEAKDQAKAIQGAINFAYDQATQDGRDFGEDSFCESIEGGKAAWNRLTTEAGFDLRGVFRRRELVPFVLIPTHVSNLHGSAEKLSLLTLLHAANEAFIFGVHLALLALMRSILEMVLKNHYRATGKDLAELITNCRRLPRDVLKSDLHQLRQLANDILHFNKEQNRLPPDFEKETLRLLFVLRALIEGVPSFAVL